MADFDALEDPHYKTFPLQAKPTSRNNRGSKFFCSNFLFRLLFIALFLSVLPLFASEAPDFISHTVFAKSWELVHLFIIGIIVSYGLFGRRKTQTQMGIQTSPTFNSPNLLHASTIFNFEHQNPCEYGVYGNANVNQAWDFRPYGLEPTVVVRPGTRDFDYEPLDLPVRSLRSMVEESDSEVCASEFENEADASSSCCCYEEDNESENLEENNVVDSSSPTPWNWPNSAQHGYLSSPCVVNPEAKQASYENCGRGLSNQSSPLCSSDSGSQSMDVEVESSWSGPTREETVLVSQPMMEDPKEKVSGVCFARDFHEVKHVKTRSFRVSSSKGSSPFSPSLSESPPMEVENSRRESVEVGSSLMEETLEDTELFPSPTSLKSRSMRVDFKEKVGGVSVHVDNNCQNLPHSKASSSEFSPLCSAASRSATAELQRGSKRQHLKSCRSPKSVSPMCDFIPPSMSESPPTEEMESLKRESKQVDNILKEMSEDHHIPSSSGQANDFPLRRFRSRKRDDFGKDVKGEMKSRTDSLRSESSCDTTSSTLPSSSSHIFTPTIEPKQSPDTGKSTQVEMNASESDLVLPSESSRTQLGAGSSLSTDVVGQSGASIEQDRRTLSRTPHSRRFSIGSFFDRDLWKGSKDATKETTKKGKDVTGSNSGKCGWDCLKLDVRPTLTKNSLRGKSVRTVRPQALTLEPSCTNEQKMDERVRERQDVVIISIGISEKNNSRKQKCTSTARQERSESSSPELGKNKERSSAVEDVNEDEECNSEIDRKADEFIAKFKEQIRLQKVASRRVSSKH